MIILDMNVLSELIKPAPDPNVVNWIGQKPVASLFTSTITQAEIFYGVALIPDSDRKKLLLETVTKMFAELFAGRTLPFDTEAAINYARIASDRRRTGRPISQFDAQIAAITRSREAKLATRNVSDFEGCGIAVINPWVERAL